MSCTSRGRMLCVAFVVFLSMLFVDAAAQRRSNRYFLRQAKPEFFKTEEAKRVAEQVLLYQRVTGGWPKNIDFVTPFTEEQKEKIKSEKAREDDSTIDNGATTMQIGYLSKLYEATGDKRYRDAVRKGVDYLLSGQYDNGGWPQFWPVTVGYQVNITYNDDAIVNTMRLLRAVAQEEWPYKGDVIDKKMRKRADEAFWKGVECILATQIVTDGKLTVWCQQHDPVTMKPASARAYELPSYCSSESNGIVRLLMELPAPDARVKKAVHSAMEWFDKYKLTGLRVIRTGWRTGNPDTKLVQDPTGVPLWGRFYDLEKCEPYVCDRDGVPRKHLDEIGKERRNGYGWYTENPGELFEMYDKWADVHDPDNKVSIDLHSKGINENGTFDMSRKHKVDVSLFDVVVSPGESIQRAVESAPELPTEPYKILVRKGVYNEKVIIDRPNIVLVGEDRDSTQIVFAELSKKRTIKEYKGKPVGNGVIVLQDEADDCVISGLTVYNNYGSTVEPTTAHQMAIFGRATRTIIVNCNVLADGNDALSLWAKDGEGMYYHADLDIKCPGVDFLCPRGWCYATRCRFLGDSRAILWHDGRGDKTKKLVVTNSTFDAKSPTVLGRYHHDAQIFLVSCNLSAQILDQNIGYAYTDKVLDPCPWGQRIYYFDCKREGGHSGWLDNNLHKAEEAVPFYAITAQWTFGGKWDPEKRIRELWSVLAY